MTGITVITMYTQPPTAVATRMMIAMVRWMENKEMTRPVKNRNTEI